MNASPLPHDEPAPAGFSRRMGSGRYFNREFNADTIKIGLGQQAVSDRPDLMIATTLGSCVAACIHDPVRRIGGTNHFMLPDLPASELEGAGMAARYGSVAMERLINALLAAGAERQRLQVKLFGGGRVIESSYDIGGLNSRFALDYVRTEGLTLAGHDLGGGFARRLHYFPHSGRALRRLLRPEAAADTVRREQRFIRLPSQLPEEGEVELFTPTDPGGS
ncbi:chemotaxis protein CheD [Azospirillum lipoferum]|uniref:Probable chemoreceptor glutamine deamidase CheD n=1 Tax=Azospirillum lipoferum TaxID=193 RepID=A0A5A9GUM7_AZOLI|nr:MULTISPECIES: chemotaxis protein [Azospirillum]KAA0598106.1 chemotaxis protein [Azospirillum lipoferum]MCP1613772.1 chemotaxis protein CheD [Azospirillum lipoferum]MDW5534776.1 chemotaxis protein [Azospirillum sp. NL1]